MSLTYSCQDGDIELDDKSIWHANTTHPSAVAAVTALNAYYPMSDENLRKAVLEAIHILESLNYARHPATAAVLARTKLHEALRLSGVPQK